MRIAPVFLTLVALAACGGKAKPPPIANQVEPPAKLPWTVERVLGTVDAEASVIAYIDVDRVRANELVTGYVDQLLAAFKDTWPEACNDLGAPHSVVIVATVDGPAGSNATMWAVGVPAAKWMKCLSESAETGPATIIVDGDYATMTTSRNHAAYLVLDDDTIIAAMGKTTPSRGELESHTEAREGSDGLRDALSVRNRTTAPIWAVARGSSFAKLPMRFDLATLTIDLSDHVAVDLDVGMVKDQATLLAQSIQQQGAMALTMGFVTALDARADGDKLLVHAELTKASIDKLVQTLKAFGGGGGAMGPFGPGGPPVP